MATETRTATLLTDGRLMLQQPHRGRFLITERTSNHLIKKYTTNSEHRDRWREVVEQRSVKGGGGGAPVKGVLGTRLLRSYIITMYTTAAQQQ